MAQIPAGTSPSIPIPAGQRLRFDPQGEGQAVLGPGPGAGASYLLGPGNVVIGPFASDRVVYVSAVRALTYTVEQQPATLPAPTADQRASMALDPTLQAALMTPAQAAAASAVTQPRRDSVLTTWWPFNEGSGTTVRDGLNPQLTATLGGTTSGIWTGGPGLNPNGTDTRAVCTLAGSPNQNIVKQICSLASMVPGQDQLLIWGIVTHPGAGVGTSGNIFTYGCSADQLWAIGWNVSSCFIDLKICPVGGTTTTTALRAGSPMFGYENSNTRTAFAVELVRSAFFPGYFEATSWKRSLITDPNDQGSVENRVIDVQELATGTALPGVPSTASMTWLASCTTNQSTFATFMPNQTAICNFGIQRRRRPNGGIGKRVVDQLYALSKAGTPYIFPSEASF